MISSIVIDFGGAVYDNENRHCTINTRQYRAPEVLLGLEWDEESIPGHTSDSVVYKIGSILFTGDVLFQTVCIEIIFIMFSMMIYCILH